MLLLIDNYDSFTYNLLHYLQELGAEVEVVRNDKITPEQILAGNYEGVVISPGPCSPAEAGICVDFIQKAAGKLPILGVCLGHQSIAYAFGGNVIRGKVPMHGKLSSITHNNQGIFAGLPPKFTVTRYHSLVVEPETLPSCLTATAISEDNIIMGLEHTEYPIYGVQFHPESIATESGHDLINNFLKLAGVNK